jgi:ABC-type sugar transport system permease subunit
MTPDKESHAVPGGRLRVRFRGWDAFVRRAARHPRLWLGLIVLVPTLLWYMVMQLGPILEVGWLAVFRVYLPDVTSWADLFQSSQFVGAYYFQVLFNPEYNPQFWPGVLHSVIWTALQFVFVLPLGLLLAVALARVARGRIIYQVALLVPFVTPTVAVALMMGKFFDPDTGAVNGALSALGLPTSQWLRDPTVALPLAAAIGAWRWLGFYAIILTAGLLNIPRDIGEAAAVDGAGAWQRFWHITLPMLGHVLALVAVLLLVNSMQEYVLPYTLAGGTQQFDPGQPTAINYGPNPTLVLLNLALYKRTFGGMFVAFGPASAGGVLELGVVLIGSVLLLKLLRPRWSY